VNAQQRTKSYKETFNVGNETILDINTTQADIVFETWDKNQIQIEATIEVEGVSEKEAEQYFQDNAIEIVGNSKKVEIGTGSGNNWVMGHSMELLQDLDIHLPQIAHMDSILFQVPRLPALAKFPEMPPMPPNPAHNFDYGAYEKEGEKYLEKWQKEFNKSFDKDFKRKMEEWSKQMEKKGREMEEKQQKAILDFERTQAQQLKAVGEQRKNAVLAYESARTAQSAHTMYIRDSLKRFYYTGDSLSGIPANMVYRSFNGKDKKLKVKKTIHIKMPKSTKIRMNVRHGEVKLAENTKNMNATLSYASLQAATIDGDGTTISASYSPVSVLKWNYGKLKTSYSEMVDLKEVGNLDLNSISSNVSIDHLVRGAIVVNRFGTLKINRISKDFKSLKVTLENAEMECTLPETAFNFNVNTTASNLKYPSGLKLGAKNSSGQQNGHYLGKGSDRVFDIVAKYSEVVLK
jgi:hypothetical protein